MISTDDKLRHIYPTGVFAKDWVIVNDPPGTDTITFWLGEVGPQPTQAELDAITEAEVLAARESTYAQTEKAEAIAGVDEAISKTGGRVERGVMSVAYSISKAENNTRLALFQLGNAIRDATTFADLKTRVAAISFPQEVTPQQVADAVKAAIAETPE